MIRRTCLPSTLRLMPVIHESTSVNSKPALDAMTWSVQAAAPAAGASMRVSQRARAKQQPRARRYDVVGPGSGTRRGGFDAGQPAVARETDQPGHPIGAVLGGA